ncbi:MAG: hypothetical protein R3C16_04065 [Hyphomonadaceae bacterium]
MSFESALLFLQQWQIALPIVLVTMAAFFFAGRRWTALYVGLRCHFINWSFAAVRTFPIPDWLGEACFSRWRSSRPRAGGARFRPCELRH